MSYSILSPEIPGETDDIILGNLAKRITHPEPDDLPLVHTPKPFIAPAVMDTCKPVEMRLTVTPYIQKRPARRVPRAWWGWIIAPKKYYRKLRDKINLILAGAYFVLLVPAVLMWLGN